MKQYLTTIVRNWLCEHGYDGLCHPDTECGCGVGNLMPCGEPGSRCEAARLDKDGMYYPTTGVSDG